MPIIYFFVVKSHRIKEELNHGVFQFFEDALEYVESKKISDDCIFYDIEKHTLSKPNTLEVVHSTFMLNEDFI